MRKVKVQLGERSYAIVIGDALLSRLGAECRRLQLGRRCAIISDRNVARRFSPLALRSLRDAGGSKPRHVGGRPRQAACLNFGSAAFALPSRWRTC